MVVLNGDQAAMAIFLLICTIFNIWFIALSSTRAFRDEFGDSPVTKSPEEGSLRRYKLLNYSIFAMALFDVPWVWLCTIQCWNNTFTEENSFHQSSGDDSPGCKFMGWYSTFSLTSMMGSHCLVAYYLMNMTTKKGHETASFLDSVRGLLCLSASLLVLSVLFGSMPLMQGDGYKLTNGGFCYADFTNAAQAGMILGFVLFFLCLSTALWYGIKSADSRFGWWPFYAVFFLTWILWIPAASYGIATGEEINSPYMLVGAILGHGNAIVNPLLYGKYLYELLWKEDSEKAKLLKDKEEEPV